MDNPPKLHCRRGLASLAKHMLFAVSVSLAAGVHAGPDEAAFKQARNYTVKVVTRVELPFYGDKKGISVGAGFVVDVTRKWIMTNAHVVARSPSEVKVAFLGSDYYFARKLYVDPYLDVAILEMAEMPKERPIEAAELDCEGAPAVGHTVGAFGHPWDLSFTGTRGIISGVTAKFAGMAEMLQTDAPINPGNSGGPLISLRTGKVVGVNTASRRSSQNTNFAVPMSQACRILELLSEGNDPSPPDLPVVFFLDLDETNRLVVAKVDEGKSSLELREGDIIQRVDGVSGEIENQGQLMHALRGRLEHARLHVNRGGVDTIVTGAVAAAKQVAERKGIYVSGILFAVNPWRDSRDFVTGKPALMIHYVEPGSIGDGQKLRSMDMLLSVDSRPVHTLDELSDYLHSAAEAKKEVVLKLIRVGDLDDSIFSYVQRPLEVGDLRIVGDSPL